MLMIEIIKEGKPTVPTFRATCSECQCVFQFHREDIKFYDTRIAIDEWKETWHIKCPCCGIDKTLGHSYEEVMELYQIRNVIKE